MSLVAWVGGRTFASLRNHRNYRLYFVSHGVSFIGTWMQQIAAYWLVLELTGSPLAVGTLALAQLLPVTLFGLFGRLGDRPLRRPPPAARDGVAARSSPPARSPSSR